MTSEPKWFDINEVKKSKLEVEDEVLAAVEEGKEEAEEEAQEHVKEFHKKLDLPAKPKNQNVDSYMLRDLRKNDRYFNKTCAACARRVPLEKIDGGKAEECDDCRGK